MKKSGTFPIVPGHSFGLPGHLFLRPVITFDCRVIVFATIESLRNICCAVNNHALVMVMVLLWNHSIELFTPRRTVSIPLCTTKQERRKFSARRFRLSCNAPNGKRPWANLRRRVRRSSAFTTHMPVNPAHFCAVRLTDTGRDHILTLSNGKELPMSRTYRKNLAKLPVEPKRGSGRDHRRIENPQKPTKKHEIGRVAQKVGRITQFWLKKFAG
jgi:hypothetical protein